MARVAPSPSLMNGILGSGLFFVADVVDVPQLLTGGCRHLRLVIHPLLQKGSRHRRVDGDVILALIDLVRSDDPQPQLIPPLVFDGHPGAKKHLAVLLR